MIKRVVAMDLLPGMEGRFLDIFDPVKKQIRSREGCRQLEILRSEDNDVVTIWTISFWDSEEDLDQYRKSDLFKQTWLAVKPLFSTKARAWTLTSIEVLA